MLTFKRTLVLKMKAQKVQVSSQPILRYTSSEDHRELMDNFILDQTWYAINSYIKWFGINPWKRQVDENGKSTLSMIKPIQFWLRFAIVFLIITAFYISFVVYICVFYVTWDDILRIESYTSESIMDSVTAFAGVYVVCFLYWPFVFKLRQFGEGIFQAQEHFKHCTKEPKKIYGKTSIYTGMYDFFYL